MAQTCPCLPSAACAPPTRPLTCQVARQPSGGHMRSLSPTRNRLGADTLDRRRASGPGRMGGVGKG
jgi:hypothetical protein